MLITLHQRSGGFIALLALILFVLIGTSLVQAASRTYRWDNLRLQGQDNDHFASINKGEIVEWEFCTGAGYYLYSVITPSGRPLNEGALGSYSCVASGTIAKETGDYNFYTVELMLPENRHTITVHITYDDPSPSHEPGKPAKPGPPAGNLLDGRLNNSQLKDVAAPVAMHCADGNINIWKINADTGEGTLIITTPQVEGTPEGGNTELASAEGVSLYWLEGGQYQLNAPNFEGKLYSITWEGCDSSTLAHLAPQP